MVKNRNVLTTILVAILMVLMPLIEIVLGFLIVSGLTWLICFGFGFTFSWPLALGVCALFILIRWILSAVKPKE